MIKSTGIVRNMDALGRIVLPKELRRTLNLTNKDSLEIYVDNEHIILKKHHQFCIFCGRSEDVSIFYGKRVCKKCASSLSKGGL